METVKRWAFHPETDLQYEIELPSSEAVQAALLELDYPARGMSSMDAANQLAEYFSLTDLQRNARVSTQSNYGVFPYLVNTEANNLVKSGQLVKPRRGWFAKPEQIREGSESELGGQALPTYTENKMATINYTGIDGKSASITSGLTIPEMIDLGVDEGLPYYKPPKDGIDNVAKRADLSYPKIEALRRSPEWLAAATAKAVELGLDINDKATQRKLGVMAATGRKTSTARISAVAASYDPEESIEADYQQIQGELAADLLQRIKDNSPYFFEKLVIDLLVAMGYGGSREEAGKAVGGSGDGGIDGVINEDILGLDMVYVQAKRWEGNVSRPEIQKFAGALQGQRARKGIFITTSDFTRESRNYVTTIDSKIVLIDGHQLAQFMIQHNVGVSTVKSYEIKRVDSDYFAEEGE